MHRKLAVIAAAILCLLAGTPQTRGDVILLVDVSNPNAIVFQSTEAFAQNDATITLSSGFTLIGFFQSTIGYDQTISFDNETVNFLYVDNKPYQFLANLNVVNYLGAMGSGRDLNLWGDHYTVTFSTEARALYHFGVVTAMAAFPIAPIGTVGNIMTDVFAGRPQGGTVIGQFMVIPEASAVSLLGLGTLLFARRRRRP